MLMHWRSLYYEVTNWQNTCSSDREANRIVREVGSQSDGIQAKLLEYPITTPHGKCYHTSSSCWDYARLHGHRQLDLAVCAEIQTTKKAVSENVHTVSKDIFGQLNTLITSFI